VGIHVVDSIIDTSSLNVIVFQTPTDPTVLDYDSAWLARALNTGDDWNFSVPIAFSVQLLRYDDVKIAGNPKADRPAFADESTQLVPAVLGEKYTATWDTALRIADTGPGLAGVVTVDNKTQGAPKHEFIDVAFLKNNKIVVTVRSVKVDSSGQMKIDPTLYFGWDTQIQQGQTWIAGDFADSSIPIGLVDPETKTLATDIWVTMTQTKAGGEITWTASYETPPTRLGTPVLSLFAQQAAVFSKQLDLLAKVTPSVSSHKPTRRLQSAFVWSASAATQEQVYAAIETKSSLVVSGLNGQDWQQVLKDKKQATPLATPLELLQLLVEVAPLLHGFTPLGLAFTSIIALAAYKGYGFNYQKAADGSYTFNFGPQGSTTKAKGTSK